MKCWWEESERQIHPSKLTMMIYDARKAGHFYRADLGIVKAVDAADLPLLFDCVRDLEDRLVAGERRVKAEPDPNRRSIYDRYLALLSLDYDGTYPTFLAALRLYEIDQEGGKEKWSRPSIRSATASAS